jgi:hypothetical protein
MTSSSRSLDKDLVESKISAPASFATSASAWSKRSRREHYRFVKEKSKSDSSNLKPAI